MTRFERRLLLRELLKEAVANLDVPTLEEYMESLRVERPYMETMKRFLPALIGLPVLGGIGALVARQAAPFIAGSILGGGVGLAGLLRAYIRQREIEEQLTHPGRARQALAQIHAQMLGRTTGMPQLGESLASVLASRL